MKQTFAEKGTDELPGFWRNQMAKWFDTVPSCAMVVLVVTIGALFRLKSHLWLDETATIWATSGGWAQLPARCISFSPSILYHSLILAIRSLGATSEWMLRLPSLLAVALASRLLFRMTERLWGAATAWLTLAAFVSIPGVAFAAGDVRAYGFGLLLVVWSTGLLLEFLKRPGFVLGFFYALAAGLAIQAHLFFAMALVAHASYFGYRCWQGCRPHAKYLWTAGLLLCVFVAPSAVSAYSLARNPAMHSFDDRPMPNDLISALFPFPIAASLLAGFVCATSFTRKIELKFDTRSSELFLSALIAFIPIFGLFALSQVSPVHVFTARYRLCYASGLATCLGVLAGRIRPQIATRVMAVALLGFHLFNLPFALTRSHTYDLGDWASALAFVDRNTATDRAPVLIRSQYIESDTLSLVPVEDNPLFSQLSFYPSRSRLIGVGQTFGPSEVQRMEDFLRNTLVNDSRRFLLLTHTGPRPVAPLIWYLRGRLGPLTSVRTLSYFDGVSVIEFTLPSTAPRS